MTIILLRILPNPSLSYTPPSIHGETSVILLDGIHNKLVALLVRPITFVDSNLQNVHKCAMTSASTNMTFALAIQSLLSEIDAHII